MSLMVVVQVIAKGDTHFIMVLREGRIKTEGLDGILAF